MRTASRPPRLALPFVVTVALLACDDPSTATANRAPKKRARSDDDGADATASRCPPDARSIEDRSACDLPHGTECTWAEPGCGSWGYRCERGVWRELYQTCNPPEVPPSATPPPAASGE